MPYSIRSFTITALLLIISSLSHAQIIRVVDADTGMPIENVSISELNGSKTCRTGQDGKADLDIFRQTKHNIIFKHSSYESAIVKLSELSAQNGLTIRLHPNNETMQTIVLTVSRSREKRGRIAEKVEILNKRQITRLSPQTSADMLANVPGVKVQKSQLGGGSPVIRGMEANRILLVVDGVRMNNAIYRRGHLHNAISIAPHVLEKTEVVFGPSSVMYGSDALGGVIYYHTRVPKFKEKGGYHPSLLARYSTADNEMTGAYSGEFSSKNMTAFTAFSFSDFGDLRMGENRMHGFDNWAYVTEYSNNTPDYYNPNPIANPHPEIQKNSGYRQWDLIQKFRFRLKEKSNIGLNIQYSRSSGIPRFDKLNERKDGALKFAEWYYGPQKRLLTSVQYHLYPEKKWIEQGDIIIAYQNIQESRNTRQFGSLDKYERKENVDVISVNGDFHVPIVRDENRRLSYGFEWTHNKVHSHATGKTLLVQGHRITGIQNYFNIQTRYPDGGSTYNTYALYTDYRLGHSPKGTLNLGLRYNYTQLHATWMDQSFIQLPQSDIQMYNSAFSGNIAYAYKLNKDFKINTVLSSGFRSPNIDDVGKIREKKGTVTVPNIGLKPEYAFNAETGISAFFMENKIHIEARTYYTLLNHYITRDYFSLNGVEYIDYDGETCRIVANVNKGLAYIYGGSLGFSIKWDTGLKISSSHTYTYGQTLDTDQPLSSIPPVFGDLFAHYHRGKWKWDTGFRYNLHKPATRYNVPEGIDNLDETPVIRPDATDPVEKYYGSPAWWTVNIGTVYHVNNTVELQLKCDNIFDAHYKEFASGISAPGRNISLSCTLSL